MPTSTPSDTAASAGPLLLGFLFNWGLYGVLSVQCLVFGLYIVETLQIVLITHDAFETFGVNYGNLPALNDAQLEGLSTPVISGIVSCTVQLFFTYRIFILSKSKALAPVICLVAIMQGGGAIATGVQTLKIDDWTKIQLEAFVSCTIWLVGAAVCDIVIAISMCYYLSKSDTGFNATHVLISKLIRLTIETGTMTATVATIDIALFLGFPHKNYHTAPALILAKLYSNTLLVTFNSRIRIANGRPSVELTSWSDGGRTRDGARRQMDQRQSRRDGTRQIEVTVDVQKGNWNDPDACTKHSQSMKMVTLVDDSTEREANLMV